MSFRFVPALFLCALLAGCGGTARNPITSGGGNSMPQVDHVFLVMLENHSFNQVIGSPSMPFLNSLATQHALATNYFAVAHPSIGNYLMLTTGQIETIDDTFTGTISDDNIAQALTAAGKTWKAYMENLPSAGFTGPDTGLYVKHHDPFSYFTSVLGSPAQTANIVPFTQLSADLAAGSVPNFAFIVPNIQNDAHDCPGGGATCADTAKLAAADSWLQTNIAPVINSPAFGNSVLIITFDEGVITDLANGGGQVATVMVGPHVKTAFQSAAFAQHQNLLRTILDLLGVSDHPGASAVAGDMADFFQ
jgi:acid phosphatase